MIAAHRVESVDNNIRVLCGIELPMKSLLILLSDVRCEFVEVAGVQHTKDAFQTEKVLSKHLAYKDLPA